MFPGFTEGVLLHICMRPDALFVEGVNPRRFREENVLALHPAVVAGCIKALGASGYLVDLPHAPGGRISIYGWDVVQSPEANWWAFVPRREVPTPNGTPS